MKEIVGSRLPSFTKQESKKMRGSFDFIGIIHYTISYVSDSPSYKDLPKKTLRRFVDNYFRYIPALNLFKNLAMAV